MSVSKFGKSFFKITRLYHNVNLNDLQKYSGNFNIT